MGDSQEEHDENLKSVLNRIEQAGMTLNKNKCVIGVEEVEFLGFKVGKDGIKAGPKIQGIVDFPSPKDVKAVRSFLGMVNQYSRFNSKISSTSAALRDLLKKDIP